MLTAAGGTGKTFFLLSLAIAGSGGPVFGPINVPRPMETLVVIGEDPQDELVRRAWDICRGQFPYHFCGLSVYGEVGPFMKLEGNNPVLAEGYHWLENTIKKHQGLELLIIDPKSRFYGLDENKNEHNTAWVQCLELLGKKYDLTILFSHHTSKAANSKSSNKTMDQGMSRGGSALVDGCRWQAGIVRMDDGTAGNYGIDRDEIRNYIIFDVPKSNYAPDIPSKLIFKRGETGVLEYCDPKKKMFEDMAYKLLELIKLDPTKYTRSALISQTAGRDIASDMKEAFPSFSRKDHMESCLNLLHSKGFIKFETINPGRNQKEIVIALK
jgi:replicative DNA helicase